MSRHLDNLKRLLQKLQARYGVDDAIVLQVKQDIEASEAIESRSSGWLVSYRGCRSGAATERQLDAVAGG